MGGHCQLEEHEHGRGSGGRWPSLYPFRNTLEFLGNYGPFTFKTTLLRHTARLRSLYQPSRCYNLHRKGIKHSAKKGTS